jgi:thiamine biosynthesis protein ThiI
VSAPARLLLVHYHEIALKRGNRPLFLRHLHRNLAGALADLGPVAVAQLTGRVVVQPGPVVDLEAAAGRVARVFGVANYAVAERVAPVLPALAAAVDRAIEGRRFASFRISARRAFKSFPLSSVEINRALGAHVLARRDCRVDLEHPELTVHVEVLPDQAYVYPDRRPGPGGLPVGVSGLVTALLSGGIDSPVAAWRLMKRGCRVDLVHFHSVPYLPDASIAKARELAAVLARWQLESRLFLVPFGELQREVVLAVPAPARVVVYRRLMLRIAEALARRRGAGALVTGESLGQVASQTLDNLARIGEAATLPVLRPLVGMDKVEITAQAQAIGTFEISIEPDADCCTLFVPRHPATRLRAEELAALEARLDVAALVAAGVAGAGEERYHFPPGAAGRPAAAPASGARDGAGERSVPSPPA